MSTFVIDDGSVRERWLEARRGYVCATDAARIFLGGAGAWAALRAEKATGESWKGNRYTEHGRSREPVLAAYAAARFGLEQNHALIGNPAFPKFAATPDARDPRARRVGEFKTTIHDWPTLDDVNREYIVQGAWQMLVDDADECLLIFEPHDGFVPIYPEPRHFVIPRGYVPEDELVAEVERWLAAEDVVPDEDAVTLDVLGQEYVVELAAFEQAKARVEAVKQRIRELLGDKPRKFEGSAANITLSVPKPAQRFQSDAFKADHPELFKQYQAASASSPRLTITPRKKEKNDE